MAEEVTFSADEQAFLNSGGEDYAALQRAYAAEGSEGKQPPPPDSQDANGADASGAKSAAKQPDAGKDASGQKAAGAADDGGKQKEVSHGAFHEERQKRKAAETENQTLREKLARVDERVQLLNEWLTKADQPEGGKNGKANAKPASAIEEEDIDPEKDIFGALDQERRRRKELMEQIASDKKTGDAKEDMRATANKWCADAETRIKSDPAFASAIAHWINTRHAELEAYGMSDPEKRKQYINREHHEMVAKAYKEQRDPFGMVMKLASARGWKAPDPAANNGQGTKNEQTKSASAESGQSAGDGGQQAQQSQKPGSIDAIKNAQDASASLSGAGGEGSKGLTLQSLVDMSDDEFRAFEKKLKPKARAELYARLGA